MATHDRKLKKVPNKHKSLNSLLAQHQLWAFIKRSLKSYCSQLYCSPTLAVPIILLLLAAGVEKTNYRLRSTPAHQTPQTYKTVMSSVLLLAHPRPAETSRTIQSASSAAFFTYSIILLFFYSFIRLATFLQT